MPGESHESSPTDLASEVAIGTFRHSSHDQNWTEITPAEAPFIREALHKANAMQSIEEGHAYLSGVADTLAAKHRIHDAEELISTFDPDTEISDE